MKRVANFNICNLKLEGTMLKIHRGVFSALLLSGVALSANSIGTTLVHAEQLNCQPRYETSFSADHDAYSASESAPTDRRICEGIAIASALVDPDLVAGETAGIKFNLATSGEEEVVALGVSVATVLKQNLFGETGRLTGTASAAFSGEQRGTRVGLQLSW